MMFAVCLSTHTAMRSFSSSFYALSDTRATAGSYAAPSASMKDRADLWKPPYVYSTNGANTG